MGPRGKAKGQSSQQLRDLSHLKVQMSMDFNHFNRGCDLFLKAQWMEVNSFKRNVAGILAGGLLALGYFSPPSLPPLPPTPHPTKKGTKGRSSAALPLQGRHCYPPAGGRKTGSCHFRAKCHSALSVTRGWMSVREEAYGVENMERNNWGGGSWGGATQTISIKNLPTNWILNPWKHLVS